MLRNNSHVLRAPFPAAILQPPFFCHGFPLALNYGAIGHEFTHGFDDVGKNYDGNGNLHNWWEPDTRNMFEERSQCFVKQYSAEYFERIQKSVNGTSTLGENIADNGGIKQSIRAYSKHLNVHGREPRTPLVDQLTNEQLFFVGFAQPYCRNVKPEELADQILNDEHAPARTRVKVVLANLPEFAEAYNCPVGSIMNPAERCTIWRCGGYRGQLGISALSTITPYAAAAAGTAITAFKRNKMKLNRNLV